MAILGNNFPVNFSISTFRLLLEDIDSKGGVLIQDEEHVQNNQVGYLFKSYQLKKIE